MSADIVDTARGGGRVVSLTFDDGPNPIDTLRLLTVLRATLWQRHDLAQLLRRYGTAAGHFVYIDPPHQRWLPGFSA